MKLNVVNGVRVYELDGRDLNPREKAELTVHSHWNRNELVILKFAEGVAVTVSGSNLKAAIDNAMNTGR